MKKESLYSTHKLDDSILSTQEEKSSILEKFVFWFRDFLESAE